MEKIKHILLKQSIDGEIFLRGSKSYTNRALILASISKGKTVLQNYSDSEDSAFLQQALKNLGVRIEQRGDILEIQGVAKFSPFHGTLYVGAAGTNIRFLIPLCCIIGGEIILRGSERLHQRPVSDLVEAMQMLGADIQYLEKDGCPPIVIRGFPQQIKNHVELSGEISSQFLSALLLVASIFPQGLSISIHGKQISQSYIDMTCLYLRKFGIHCENKDYKSYYIPAQTPKGQTLFVEGDASGASYFWALAALSQGRMCVHNISPESVQGDVRFSNILQKMGCEVKISKNSITVENKVGTLNSVNADMLLMPDTAQTLAVIASQAQGKTTISGLSTLKHKETDRCKATCYELKKMGVVCGYDDNTLFVEGSTSSQTAIIDTYKDHRMAMAFAILGCLPLGIKIRNPEVVKKSFPRFWEELKRYSC